MTKRTSFNPKARAEEIAAQLKAAEQAQKDYDASIEEAVKHAGRTRAEFVEVLYGHFGIDPEVTERKDKNGDVVTGKDGQPVRVRTDKDETVRIEKLAAKFEELVAKAEVSKEGSPSKQSQSGSGEVESTGPAPVPDRKNAA